MKKDNEKLYSKKAGASLLVLGVALTIVSAYRWGVELVAWVYLTPFIMHVMGTRGVKSRSLLLIAMLIGINGLLSKIVTPPIPIFFPLLFGVPSAISLWVLVLVWNFLRKKLHHNLWIPLFVSLTVISEWISFAHSDFGMWGTYAASQLNNLPLLQVASFAGISGIAVLMSAVTVWLALFLYSDNRKIWYPSGITIGILIFASLMYGSVRMYKSQEGPLVTAAAITTDLHPGPKGFPEGEVLQKGTEQLFERSAKAARAGAKIVVWNEGATLTDSLHEKALLDRGAQFSKTYHTDLVMAYIIPLSRKPLKMGNKYVWFADDGTIVETYRKHHPVPGEGSIRGTEPLQVIHRPWGSAAGAICYDYDFPAMSKAHGKQSAGLTMVPSSDWKGIDPYHTQMTRIRAIEGGFSVIRPVRWATSAAYDAYGRLRAAMPYDEGGRIMLVTLPVKPVATLYEKVGDWPVVGAFIVVAVCTVLLFVRRRV